MPVGVRFTLQPDTLKLVCDYLSNSQDWKIQQARAMMLDNLQKHLQGEKRNYAPNKQSADSILQSLGEAPVVKPELISGDKAADIIDNLKMDVEVTPEEIDSLAHYLDDRQSHTEEIDGLINDWFMAKHFK